MKRHTKSFKITPEKYVDFLTMGASDIEVETNKLKKKSKDSEFTNKNIKANVVYDKKSETATLTYEIKNEEKIDEIDLHYLKKSIEKKIPQFIKNENDSPYNKKQLFKTLIGVTIFALLLWSLINFVFGVTMEDIKNGYDSLFGNTSAWSIFPIFNIFFIGLTPSITLYILLKYVFKKKANFFILYIAFVSGSFIEAMSPINGVGGIFSIFIIYNLQKGKFRTAEIAMAGLISGNITNIVVIVISIVSLSAFTPYIGSLPFQSDWVVYGLFGLSWSGVAILSINVIIFALLAYSIKFQKLTAWGITLGFKIINKGHLAPKITEETLFQGRRLKSATNKLLKLWFIWPTIIVVSLGIKFWAATATWVIQNQIEPGFMTWIQSLSTDVIVAVSGFAIPLPGNVGVSEYFMSEMYYAIANGLNNLDLSTEEIESIVLIQRTTTYYAKVAYSALVFTSVSVASPFYLKWSKKA